MKCVIAFALLTLGFACNALADIPKAINYQGLLLDAANQPVADGQHTVMFKLYDAENAVNSVWYEERELTTQDGYFHILLGSVSALDPDHFNQPLWLGITVKGEAEMSPRQPLAATPYALTVADGTVDTLKLPPNAVSSVSMMKGSAADVLPMTQTWAVFPGLEKEISTDNSWMIFILNIGGYGHSSGSGIYYQLFIDGQEMDPDQEFHWYAASSGASCHEYASQVWTTLEALAKGKHVIQLKYKYVTPYANITGFNIWDPQKITILELKR